MSTPPPGGGPEERREPPPSGQTPGPGDPGWGTPPPPPQAARQPSQQGWGTDPQSYGYGQVREHAPGAVASLVLGILGLFTIPLILSIIAVVLGNQSKRATAAEPHRYNDQLGQVGRILGWIGIGLALAGLLVLVFVFVALFPMRVS